MDNVQKSGCCPGCIEGRGCEGGCPSKNNPALFTGYQLPAVVLVGLVTSSAAALLLHKVAPQKGRPTTLIIAGTGFYTLGVAIGKAWADYQTKQATAA